MSNIVIKYFMKDNRNS